MILNNEEIRLHWKPIYRSGKRASAVIPRYGQREAGRAIAEAEHKATLKAVGNALLKLETLQQFHRARVELHEGRMI